MESQGLADIRDALRTITVLWEFLSEFLKIAVYMLAFVYKPLYSIPVLSSP